MPQFSLTYTRLLFWLIKEGDQDVLSQKPNVTTDLIGCIHMIDRYVTIIFSPYICYRLNSKAYNDEESVVVKKKEFICNNLIKGRYVCDEIEQRNVIKYERPLIVS